MPQIYSALFKNDSILGYVPVRNSIVNIQIDNNKYQLNFNFEGVIDQANDVDAKFLILGDGVIAGYELDRGQRIAKSLEVNGCNAVVNLAVPGYGPLQELLLLENWLNHHKPPEHVIIVFNPHNDIIDNVKDWEGSNRIPGIVVHSDGSYTIEGPELPNFARSSIANLLKKSRFYGYLVSLMSVEKSGNTSGILFDEYQSKRYEMGLNMLSWIGARFQDLANWYGFTLNILIWKDYGLLKDQAVLFPTIEKNIEKAFSSKSIKMDFDTNIRSYKQWELERLVPGTRHANVLTTQHIVKSILDYFNCGRIVK